jgi:hypothetical protein
MSEHHGAPKAHEPHALHEEDTKGPHDPRNTQDENCRRCYAVYETNEERLWFLRHGRGTIHRLLKANRTGSRLYSKVK